MQFLFNFLAKGAHNLYAKLVCIHCCMSAVEYHWGFIWVAHVWTRCMEENPAVFHFSLVLFFFRGFYEHHCWAQKHCKLKLSLFALCLSCSFFNLPLPFFSDILFSLLLLDIWSIFNKLFESETKRKLKVYSSQLLKFMIKYSFCN